MARGGPFDGHRYPHFYCCQATQRPVEVSHPGEIPRNVLHRENNDWDGLDYRGWCKEEEVEFSCRRLARQVVRVEQPVDQLRALHQGQLHLAALLQGQKCKESGSRDHGLSEWKGKEKKRCWQLVGGTEVGEEEVEVVEVASLANRNDLYQFIRAYLCLLAPSRPNKIIKFRLTDASNLHWPTCPPRWSWEHGQTFSIDIQETYEFTSR